MKEVIDFQYKTKHYSYKHNASSDLIEQKAYKFVWNDLQMSILIEIHPKRRGKKFTHWDASKYACTVSAHALRYGVCNHISISPLSSHLSLNLRFSVKLPQDASKFCFRNGGIIEKRKHALLVWLYIFPMPDIGTMTLLSQQYNCGIT